MSFKTLWFLLIVTLIILGFIIYLAYFLEIKTKSVEVMPKGGESSSGTFPELEQVIVPPPDYGDASSQEPSDSSPNIAPPPEIPQLQIVGYRGIIIRITPSSVEFKTILPEEGKLLTATVDTETKITQVFLREKAIRETIKLEDLKVGDEIVIGGMARDYGEPILDTINIERFYLE